MMRASILILCLLAAAPARAETFTEQVYRVLWPHAVTAPAAESGAVQAHPPGLEPTAPVAQIVPFVDQHPPGLNPTPLPKPKPKPAAHQRKAKRNPCKKC